MNHAREMYWLLRDWECPRCHAINFRVRPRCRDCGLIFRTTIHPKTLASNRAPQAVTVRIKHEHNSGQA